MDGSCNTIAKVSEFEEEIQMMRWESECERKKKGRQLTAAVVVKMKASERLGNVTL